MKVAGLIFSNIHDGCIPEMTHFRTMASIPFGCRYRLIDFALSNMVNSGITNVGIITHYNYRSLLDHIGTGKDWDLSRRSGGIKIISPYVTAFENQVSGKMYENRLEAIVGASSFIKRCGADYIVMSDCDVILNIDLNEVVEDHINSGAYITLVTKKLKSSLLTTEKNMKVVKIGENNRVLDIVNYKKGQRDINVNTNIMVISRFDLEELISDVLSHSYRDLTDDLFLKKLKKKLFRAWCYDGWYDYISSLESYFKVSMKLLTPEAREGLFYSGGRRIYTKLRNSAPVKYSSGAMVKNSLIADGCTIEGCVENSILFRGVHVGKGSVVRNSILLQDTFVSNDADINCTIADKNVVIKDSRRLSGHDTMPFFITKGTVV
ncbi:MAG: glucose-1-phosphate adenylyltransferase subunit GlgD [Ruminococcaceae bacterium]|nr:glucose-1-phosphate adenylyltransferase subunit GlgD [Oscillospiraceae bacterium]